MRGVWAGRINPHAASIRSFADAARIIHWEQGLREPGWSKVLALATALEVDCREFLEALGPDWR